MIRISETDEILGPFLSKSSHSSLNYLFCSVLKANGEEKLDYEHVWKGNAPNLLRSRFE